MYVRSWFILSRQHQVIMLCTSRSRHHSTTCTPHHWWSELSQFVYKIGCFDLLFLFLQIIHTVPCLGSVQYQYTRHITNLSSHGQPSDLKSLNPLSGPEINADSSHMHKMSSRNSTKFVAQHLGTSAIKGTQHLHYVLISEISALCFITFLLNFHN